jgi:hypothetical protein
MILFFLFFPFFLQKIASRIFLDEDWIFSKISRNLTKLLGFLPKKASTRSICPVSKKLIVKVGESSISFFVSSIVLMPDGHLLFSCHEKSKQKNHRSSEIG